MLKQAFKVLLSIHSRPVTIIRNNAPLVGTIGITPSNFVRELAVEQDVTTKGREFVVDIDQVVAIPTLGILKRGDVLVDPVLGRLAITEVKEVYGLGAEILGFRVRTS